jgi:hypothetical protein
MRSTDSFCPGELYRFKSMDEGHSLAVRYASNPKVTQSEVKYKRSWLIWWSVVATFQIGALVMLL